MFAIYSITMELTFEKFSRQIRLNGGIISPYILKSDLAVMFPLYND